MPARPTLLVLQYDGGSYAGWQRQPATRTIQGEIEAVVARLLGRRVPVVGAGRTDAGVHATGQVAATQFPERWPCAEVVRAMNALLPPDIWVVGARRMVPGFNPRRHAVERTYCYRVGTDPGARSPFRGRHEWSVGPLEESRLAAAAAPLAGTHSFVALSAKGADRARHRCRGLEAQWLRREDAPGYEFWITADRFLRHMVRFLAGLMVEIGRGRRPVADVRRLLGAPDNREAAAPAPPHGLVLVGVRYPPHLFARAS